MQESLLYPARGPPAPCCACCRAARRRASPLACLAACCLVLTYNLLGGFLFLALEGGGGGAAHDTPVAASKHDPARARDPAADLRRLTVDRLWAITEDLNILYKENWTELAARELVDFQRVLVESASAVPPGAARDRELDHRWTFAGSFLYALTLITTIGHGNVAPRSSAGKMVAVAYAGVGIPIVMLYLSTVGEALARNFRILYSKVRPARLGGADPRPKPEPAAGARTPFQAALNLAAIGARPRRACAEHTRVPLALTLLLVALYVALGSVVFRATEKWDFVDGCYFSFSSLATVGFGSLRPGRHASTVSAAAEDAALGACCAYILVGVAVVAMCFDLVREEAAAAARGAALLCAGGGRRAVHGEGAGAGGGMGMRGEDKPALS